MAKPRDQDMESIIENDELNATVYQQEPDLPFSEKTIRQAFIRKVYSILMVQLLITGGFIALLSLCDPIKEWTMENPAVLIVALVLSVVLILILVCCKDARRKFPLNFILLFLFTVIEGFLVGFICSMYEVNSVLIAAGITAVICFSLTIFAFQTKYDFTGGGPYLFVFLIVLVLFGILTISLRTIVPVLDIVYSCLGALLFSAYLIFDTQLIIGGHHKQSISPEEYIFAALTLYLDILNIFLKILRIVGRARG